MDNYEGVSDSGSEAENFELTDRELQEAFAKGLLKPGLNAVLEEKKKTKNYVEGLKQCLADFRRDFDWVERLDMTNEAAADFVAKAEGCLSEGDCKDVDTEDDFHREMFFYRQAQATVLEALPRLHKLKIPTKRPEDYFAEMAKSDQHMQKVREKLLAKQTAMERSEKAKQLRALRKYGKKVQTEVLQKRQKEKKAMLMEIKKYQKGFSDKLDFLEGDHSTQKKRENNAASHIKKGPNAKRRYKNQKFGFGGKKKGSKWNTKESYDDVSGFRASVAHAKHFGKGKKAKHQKRPGKNVRRKMKNKSR